MDRFITEEECADIIHTYLHAVERAKHSLTPAVRKYNTWNECACWYLKHIGSASVGRTLDRVREMIIKHAHAYFNDDGPLGLDFTNMTALGPASFHPLHADYEQQIAVVNGEGAWVDNHTPYRKYAAMVYLNTSGVDYQGGRIYFPNVVDNTVDEHLIVTPHAGRFVTFSGGREHQHATTPVLAGMRYAIATWITTVESLFESWQ